MKMLFRIVLLSFFPFLFTGCIFMTKEQRWQFAEVFGLPSGRPGPPMESDDISSIVITDDVQEILYNGIYLRSNDGEINTSYLRFYKDGIVITVTSTGSPEQIKEWFNIGGENISKGNYEITDNNISFSSTTEYGTVDYMGIIIENGLIIDVHSNINGRKAKNLIYKFYSW